jgi:hypothetical protein
MRHVSQSDGPVQFIDIDATGRHAPSFRPGLRSWSRGAAVRASRSGSGSLSQHVSHSRVLEVGTRQILRFQRQRIGVQPPSPGGQGAASQGNPCVVSGPIWVHIHQTTPASGRRRPLSPLPRAQRAVQARATPWATPSATDAGGKASGFNQRNRGRKKEAPARRLNFRRGPPLLLTQRQVKQLTGRWGEISSVVVISMQLIFDARAIDSPPK